jgi:oxygen-independent coproporphyrinogen-3 oxidase
VGREVLDAGTRRVEDLMLGVRMRSGVSLATLADNQRAEASALVAEGLASVDEGTLRLTRTGRLLADAVIRRLVP